jgi:hypothetical protein
MTSLTRRRLARAARAGVFATARISGRNSAPIRRMLFLCTPLGVNPANFLPTEAGRDYALSPCLETLKDFRNDFTVMSGLAHPEVGSSHDSIQGVSHGHHDLSHHGQDPAKLAQLKTLELEKMKTLAELLEKLKQTEEQGESLLDRTMVFFSSNLGNASNHSTRNLPVLLAGGGFKHGQHLAFDPKNAPPLCNLYVSMLQRMGIETEKFSSGTGPLKGLEML